MTTRSGQTTSRKPRGPGPTTRSSPTRISTCPSCTACCRPATSGDAKARTPADNQTVRNVFVIGPDKKIKLILVYPMTTGRNFDEVLRVIDSLQLTAKHRVATPVNWKQGEDVIIAGSVSNDEAKEIYGDWKEPEALYPDRPAAQLAVPLRVLVLGAGFGGLELSTRLAERARRPGTGHAH